QKDEEIISEDSLLAFYEKKIKDQNYIVQKYISSRSLQGDPFDCRVHVEKGGNGEWVNAKNFIRVGIGQKVVSNVSQGGGISEPENFLKANFGEKWQVINDEIKKLAATLPYRIEEFRKTKMMTMGMDIGIDKDDGKLYLFEINGAPITGPLRADAVMLRAEYY